MKMNKLFIAIFFLTLILLAPFFSSAEDLTCTDIENSVDTANAYPMSLLDEVYNVPYCGNATWYAVDLVAGHGYTIMLTATMNSGGLDFGLYEADGVTEIVGPSDYNLTDGQVGIAEKTIARSGTYYLKVVQYGSTVADGGYELAIYNAWFNPGVTDADRDYYKTYYTARLAQTGTYSADSLPNHVYRFVAQQGTPVEVSITAHIGGSYMDFGIYAADDRELSSSNDSAIYNGETGMATATYLVDGVYFIKVWGSVAGTYDLTITGALADADTDGEGLFDAAEYYHGTDISSADTDGDGATDFSELQSGTFPTISTAFTAVDVATAIDPANALVLPSPDAKIHSEYIGTSTWYAVDLVAGNGYSIVLTTTMNSGGLDFGLYEADGVTEIVGSNDVNLTDGQTGIAEKTIARSGTYYLRVFQYGTAVTEGSYDLAIYNAWFNPGVTDVDRDYYKTYYTARLAQTGTYSANSLPNHVYRFVAQQGTPVEVSITAHIGGSYMDFGIYATDDRELAGSNDANIYNGRPVRPRRRIWSTGFILSRCGAA